MIDKGKKYSILEHRSFRWLILVELWLLLVLFGLLLVRQENSYYFPDTVWEYNGQGNVSMKAITLERGLYRVQISYESDADMVYLAYAEQFRETAGNSAVQCGGEYLRRGVGVTDFDLWVTDSQAQVIVKAQCGTGKTVLKNVAILQKQEDIFQAMLWVAVVGLPLNILCVCWLRRGYRSREENHRIFLSCMGVTIITVIASIPLFSDVIWVNREILQQLFRIGSLKEGLLGGQLPVRLAPGYFDGNGYASPIYQGELFFYFPALLRVLGVPLQDCWKWLLFGSNLATCVAAFRCLYKLSGSSRKAMLGSAVYTLFPLRLYGMYRLGAADWVLAAVFLPIVVYGLYELLFGKKEMPKNCSWLMLALGFTGLLQSHKGICGVVAVVAVLVCLFRWRRLREKAVTVWLCKGAVWLLIWNLWFLVPGLDYLWNMDVAGQEQTEAESEEEQYQEGWYSIYDEKALSANVFSKGRYLPDGTDVQKLSWYPPKGGEGIHVTGYERQYLDLTIECENTTTQEGFIEIPFLNYRGFRAQSLVNGSLLRIDENENHNIKVVVPKGFQGKIHIYFKEPWYWRAAVWCSVLGIAVVAGWNIRRRLNLGLHLMKEN